MGDRVQKTQLGPVVSNSNHTAGIGLPVRPGPPRRHDVMPLRGPQSVHDGGNAGSRDGVLVPLEIVTVRDQMKKCRILKDSLSAPSGAGYVAVVRRVPAQLHVDIDTLTRRERLERVALLVVRYTSATGDSQ